MRGPRYAFTVNRSERYFWPAIFVLGAVVGAGVTCIVRLAIGPGLAGPALNVVSAITAGSAFGLSLLTYRYNGRKSKREPLRQHAREAGST